MVACRQVASKGKAADPLQAHVHSLGLAGSADTAVHPLEGVLEDLSYPHWQLDTPTPQIPQVGYGVF